ncbi:hypothetical protein Slala02_58960 [Streptomyces lavendulae subsp. lavendulae]|nr:hypothetical protein Slala01_62370 [Streptomyces lavendulae subsp. lavendulae]GLX30076.1 hypothetical protein Slala02_58960 [Streptomyces lavendulae subsp. lavendulae]
MWARRNNRPPHPPRAPPLPAAELVQGQPKPEPTCRDIPAAPPTARIALPNPRLSTPTPKEAPCPLHPPPPW